MIAVASGLVSEEPPHSSWSTASRVAEAQRRYPQLTRKLESFVWLARSRGWVLQDAGVHEGSAFVIVGLLGAQQARDTPRVELLNQHAGELGWTISEVVFDARGWIILYEHPPVEPSTLASESSDDGVVEVGGRAGGSDAFSEDAQDAQQGLVAGQSEVVPTLWGEGGTGWASSTADAPSEEVHQEQNQGQISSPDPLADELLRQGFWRIQDSPGEYFNWLVFPSPGIELPFTRKTLQ